MWGSLTVFIVVAAAVVALPISLLVLASPLFALIIFVIVGGVLLAGAALLRSSQFVERTEGEDESRRGDARQAQSPRTGGAPVTGEGGAPTPR